MLVNELRVGVASQQHAEIVEPGQDALKLDAVHEEYGDRNLVLSDVLEKNVLNVLRFFTGHSASAPFLLSVGFWWALRGSRKKVLSRPFRPLRWHVCASAFNLPLQARFLPLYLSAPASSTHRSPKRG